MAKKITDEDGNKYVQKKPFYKRVWFWILVVIIVIGVGANMGSDGDKTSSSSTNSSSSSTKSTSNGITKAQWDKIKLSETDGDTSDTVVKLIGKASSTSSSTISNIQVDVHTWNKVANATIGAVTVSFENGHAVSKGITGLNVNRSKKITLDNFNTIANGQTTSQIEKEFGKPNGYTVTTIAGTNTET